MRKFVIMGVQGSGKGTQAGLLADDLDLVHLSVGDIFRWHVQRHTKLGAQVRRIMAAGELVDDELVESVMRDRLAIHDWNYGFIVDGFPRNAAPGRVLPRELRHRRRDQPRHARRRGPRAGAVAAPVLAAAGWTGTSSPTARRSPTSATSARSALLVREDDQPERPGRAPARLPREDRARASSCSSARSSSPLRRHRARSPRSRPRSAERFNLPRSPADPSSLLTALGRSL